MDTDVLVIGGGNAALCAALMAREAGARVLLLESAPRAWRGGNSAHTRNLRCMHDAPQDVLVDTYPEEDYWQDLLKVTGGRTSEPLARLAIRASATGSVTGPAGARGRVTSTTRAAIPRPASRPAAAMSRVSIILRF